MKKTLTINLNGIVFNIDDDAYEALNNYLSEIENHFGSDEKDEIMKDIESRIAELFTAALVGRNVVEIKDVNDIIEKLGKPSDFGEEHTINEPTKEMKRTHRKFYRSSDDKLLGGVASGLAAYLGWDVALVRIIFALLLFVSVGIAFFLYALLWILVPEASTTAQKLEMQGIEPTVDNIRNYTPKEPTTQSRGGELIVGILKVILIIITGFTALAFLVTAFGLVITAFGLASGPFEIAAFCSGIVLALIPSIGLFRLCLRLINDKLPHHTWVGWTMLVVWILCFLLLCFSIKQVNYRSKIHNAIYDVANTLRDDENQITESRPIASGFHVLDIDNATRVETEIADTFMLAVKASAEDLRQVDLEFRDSTLYIDRGGAVGHVTIYVTMPELGYAVLDNASHLIVKGNKMEYIKLQLDNASACELTADSIEKLSVIADEASRVDVESKIGFADVYLDNVSKANIGKSDQLNMNVGDACKFTYAGHPKLKDVHVEVTGKTKNIEE